MPRLSASCRVAVSVFRRIRAFTGSELEPAYPFVAAIKKVPSWVAGRGNGWVFQVVRLGLEPVIVAVAARSEGSSVVRTNSRVVWNAAHNGRPVFLSSQVWRASFPAVLVRYWG